VVLTAIKHISTHFFLVSFLPADMVDSVANAVDHPASPFTAVGIKSSYFSADNIRQKIEEVEEVSHSLSIPKTGVTSISKTGVTSAPSHPSGGSGHREDPLLLYGWHKPGRLRRDTCSCQAIH
jgi:hypothetical protein